MADCVVDKLFMSVLANSRSKSCRLENILMQTSAEPIALQLNAIHALNSTYSRYDTVCLVIYGKNDIHVYWLSICNTSNGRNFYETDSVAKSNMLPKIWKEIADRSGQSMRDNDAEEKIYDALVASVSNWPL